MLLENTKVQNYVNGDRHVGFNVEETFAVLKVKCYFTFDFFIIQLTLLLSDLQSLAKFHAIGIAMRHLQPTLFNEHISPYLEAVNLILDDNDTQMVDVSRII